MYNPLEYARETYRAYLDAYANAETHVIYLGMNPGPFGMAQTGVPFGDVSWVRDWLGIEGSVGKPLREHPRRPIDGFACTRKEVSGGRLWAAVSSHYETPERFFRRAFVANYCPLLFLEEGGRNRTPDKLPVREREPLFGACDRHLRRLVELLSPAWVIGVGAFAQARARACLGDADLRLGGILHPSPANPRANRDWEGEARRQLEALGLCRHSGNRPRA